MSDANPNPDRVLYLKYWHIVLMLVVQLIALGIAYGKLSEGLDDVRRQVSAIESRRFVPREEFDAWRQDVRDTLARIEIEILRRNASGK